jgi:hypothetical protein
MRLCENRYGAFNTLRARRLRVLVHFQDGEKARRWSGPILTITTLLDTLAFKCDKVVLLVALVDND